MALGTTAAIIAGGLLGGGLGFGVSQMVQSGSNSKPQPMPIPAVPKVEEAEDAADKAALAKRRAMANSKTVFTSPLGISGEANVVRKTLLGE